MPQAAQCKRGAAVGVWRHINAHLGSVLLGGLDDGLALGDLQQAGGVRRKMHTQLRHLRVLRLRGIDACTKQTLICLTDHQVRHFSQSRFGDAVTNFCSRSKTWPAFLAMQWTGAWTRSHQKRHATLLRGPGMFQT